MGNRVLVFAWLAAVGVVSIAANVAYGVTAFSDVPHIDDWAHIYRLGRLENGDISLMQYLATRHNGHPNVGSSVAFLLSYQWAELDLRWARWAMLLLAVGSTALAATIIIRAADRPFGPMIVLAVPAAILTGLSLAGWETYSVTANVTFAVSTFCTLASVAAFSLWLQRGAHFWLGLALLLAMVSSINGLHGCLAILALAGMAYLAPNRRVVIAALLLVLFVVIATLNFAAAGADVANHQYSLPHMLRGFAMLAGLPWFAPVGARASPEALTAIGLVVLPAIAGLVVWVFRQDRATKDRALPFLALLGVGAGAAIMIAVSRSYQPLEAIAASRYMAPLFPGAVGVLGLAGIAAERAGHGRSVLGALFAFAFVGSSLGAQEEFKMAPYRAQAFEGIRARATAEAPLTTDVMVREFYLDPGEAGHYVAPAIAFMRDKRVGLMRPSRATD